MSEDELLAAIALKILTMEDYLDPQPHGQADPVIRIDGLIDGFTSEEIALIRTIRTNYMNRPR
jgi:hypothetical protein